MAWIKTIDLTYSTSSKIMPPKPCWSNPVGLTLMKALDASSKGMPKWKAARDFDIPYGTLKDNLKEEAIKC
ncbi:hypothetical protein ElyMa_005387500 [Elysia marginata]|uniref:HTH psq-type domain-containing protein n=1 Tax=Elysia marginata TaxID=1093978 RepID=A0AAV4EFG0_9GAST|nr:hypothetical protein ElyMa_005387500 [Elysia marginata]